MVESAIELRAVSKRFGPRLALDCLDLRVPRGVVACARTRSGERGLDGVVVVAPCDRGRGDLRLDHD